jgi:hypothetical protein
MEYERYRRGIGKTYQGMSNQRANTAHAHQVNPACRQMFWQLLVREIEYRLDIFPIRLWLVDIISITLAPPP